jgi:type VI secretion system protein ImpC
MLLLNSQSHGKPAPRLLAMSDPFTAMLRDLVAPYAVPKPDPKQVELIAQIERATEEVMRAILHHPAFQALEAAWRGLDQVVKAVETGNA